MNIFATGRRRALRTVQEYWETVEYIHLNPVRPGLVGRTVEWGWSSAANAHESRQTRHGGVAVL
jgi:hypothetical protein